MDKVFFNAQAQNLAGNIMPKTAFDLYHDKFVKMAGIDFSNIPAKRFFRLEGKKAKVLRKNKEYKEISVDNGRNIFSMRLSKPETRRKKFEEGQVLVLIKPHPHYYHTSFNEAKKRIVFDVLNEKFIIMTSDKYKEYGFNKFSRGSTIELRDGNWSRLGSASKTRFKDRVNDIEMQDIVDEVSENLMTWRYKGKTDRKCARCKKTCNQLEGVLYSCRAYIPIKPRKKRAILKEEVAKKKSEGMMDDLKAADVGNQMEKEIKEVSKRKK